LSNKPAVAGVFTVVALIAICLSHLAALITVTARRGSRRALGSLNPATQESGRDCLRQRHCLVLDSMVLAP